MGLNIETCNEDELCDFVRFNATAVIGTKCPHCGFVGGEGLSRVDKPCPNCGKTGKSRGRGRAGYPYGDAEYLLMMISDFYVRSIEHTDAKIEEALSAIQSRFLPGFNRGDLVDANTELRRLYNSESDVNKRYENIKGFVSSFLNTEDENQIAELMVLILRVERGSYLDVGVVLITMTLIEVLYKNFLQDLCDIENASFNRLYDRSSTTDRSWFGKCENVFTALKGTHIKDFLNEGDRLNLYLNLLVLRRKRNIFVHGRSPFIIGRGDSISAVRLSLLVCLVFQELNNIHCVQKV